MVLGLEVNKIRDVLSGCSLSIARVTQTRPRSSYCLVPFRQAISVKRLDLEVLKQEREAIVFRPLPIVERRQRHIKTEFFPRRMPNTIRAFQRQRRGLNFARETCL